MVYTGGNSSSVHNIHYGDIHTKYSNYIDMNKISVPFLIDEGQHIDPKKMLKIGDIVVADASEDYTGVGSCVEILNLEDRKCVAGLHTFALRAKSDRIALGYGALILKNKNVHNWMKRVSTYSKVYGITKGNFGDISIHLPTTEEQRAIAGIMQTHELSMSKLVEIRRLAISQKKYLINNLAIGKLEIVVKETPNA
jgi:type I restriction enzyme S subunit